MKDRVHLLLDAPIRAEGVFVLYWMQAARRMRSNFALDRAIRLAQDLSLPVVIAETWPFERSTTRHAKFAIEGMRDNRDAAARAPITYLPFVEEEPGTLKQYLARLAARAAVVVTDQLLGPPVGDGHHLEANTRVEGVDTYGIVPLSATSGISASAYVFRRRIQKILHDGWERPARAPLAGLNLPQTDLERLEVPRWERLRHLDEDVGAVDTVGGATVGGDRLTKFVAAVDGYGVDRNHPDAAATSGLSAYLRYGHVAGTDVVDAVLAGQGFEPERTGPIKGQRSGWWNLDEAREAFLDQIVTWRELGYHYAWHDPNYAAYDTLPQWAQDVLATHAHDPRPITYTFDQLEQADTYDEIWNAAQRELLQTGLMHNYMRMLWGKKILEWTADPREAFDRAVYLNDKWALDGCDPNSYTGISWVFGRFDRPWGPRRDIFGTIRYMSSDSARRKLRLSDYLAQYGPQTSLL